MNEQDTERLTRRELLLKLAAAGALGAGGILGLVRDALAAGSLPATPGFRYIRGPVGVDDTRASIGLNIKPGQTVMTGEGGEAVYIIGPDAFLQREKTKISFEDSGVVTSTATIGIRGTGCYLEAEAARTYFCLCYGEAEVTPRGDPKQKEAIRSEHHDHPLVINASGEKLMVPAKVVNHTDAELTMLENTVGRWPPFYGQGGNRY